MKNRAIPISIISGFLGCGKTTFINKLINGFPDKKTGVVVNEFGEIPVESQLINTSENQIVELNSSCMCCMVRKDITSAVEDLIAVNPELDYIFVEASGLSDPVPVAQTFIHNTLNGKIKLDTIVNLIDASGFMQNFSRFNIISQQVRLANFVFLTKLDIAPDRSIEFARSFAKNLGKKTKVYELTDDFPLEKFFDIIDLNLIDTAPVARDHEHHHHHIDVDVINFKTDRKLDPEKFKHFIGYELDGIVRAKGIVHCLTKEGDGEKYILQAVAERKELKKQQPVTDKTATTILIIIGMDLNREQILSQLENCLIEESREYDINSISKPPNCPTD